MTTQEIAQRVTDAARADMAAVDTAYRNMPYAADSLPDSVAYGGGFPVGDSLGAMMPDALVSTVGEYAEPAADTLAVTAREMFGTASYMPDAVTGGFMYNDMPFLSDSIVFKFAALICFAGYCVTFYLYRQQVYALLGVFRSKLYVDNMLGERNYTFDSFLNRVALLGILTFSLVAIKAADIAVGGEIAASLPEWAIYLIVPVVWGLFGMLFFYQTLVLRIAGTLTLSQKFIADIRYLRKIIFSVLSLLLIPFLLMSAMADRKDALTISILLLAGLAIVIIFLIARTYELFVEEKISKLYWFLYLCAVEIFPVTLLLLSIRKVFL